MALVSTVLLCFAYATNAQILGGYSETRFFNAIFFDSSPRKPMSYDDEKRYLAVNKIVCSVLHDTVDVLGQHSQIHELLQMNGTLVGSRTTVATVAHDFYNQDTGFTNLAASDCRYLVYNEYGAEVDDIPVRMIKSRWQDTGQYNDPEKDLAILTLARAPRLDVMPMQVKIPTEVDEVCIVAFGIDSLLRKLKSCGRVADRKGTPERYHRNILIYSASETKGTSGGPVIDAHTGAVVALNIGSVQQRKWKAPTQFSAIANYNRGVAIDEQFFADLAAAIRMPASTVLVPNATHADKRVHR